MAKEVKEVVVDDKPYSYFEQNVVSKIHHYYLSDIIGHPADYTEMIHQIKTGSPHDVIYIHLNTVGGQLNTGVQIINAMQTSESHIVCSLESEAHSLGTLIFLAADEFLVHDNCIMMFHNYSGGMWGKGNEQVAQLDAVITWFETLARRMYVPFLSDEEVDRILKGEDIWLQTADIRKRLIKMVKILDKQAKAELAPAKRKVAPKK